MADPTSWGPEDEKIKRRRDIQAAQALVHSKIAEHARASCDVFMEFVFRVKQAPCHRKMQEHMASRDRAGILAQREIGKTTQAVGRVIWRVGNHPDSLFKLVCSSDELAVDRIMLIRDVISRNPRLRAVFPGLRKSPWVEDWGKKSLTVKRDVFSKDSSIEACGVLTQGAGGRADEILFDDVVDLNNAVKYPLLRPQVKTAFKNTWIPLLGPKGRAIYLATLYHEDDLTVELMKNTEWNWLDLSVRGDPPVSEWPERWSPEALVKRQAEIGSIEFDRAMRNVLHPDRERIVQEGWIRRFESPPPRGPIRIASWDFAASGGAGDWTARSVLDVSFSERLIRVIRMDRWRGLTYNEMIDLMLSDFTTWTPSDVLIESTGFQVIMGRDERLWPLPVRQITPKVSKEQRVRQTAVLFERGHVLFQDGTCESGIAELLAFPRASHDDLVDSLVQGILFAVEKMGAPFDPGQAVATGPRVFGGPSSEHARVVDAESRTFSKSRAGFGSVKW